MEYIYNLYNLYFVTARLLDIKFVYLIQQWDIILQERRTKVEQNMSSGGKTERNYNYRNIAELDKRTIQFTLQKQFYKCHVIVNNYLSSFIIIPLLFLYFVRTNLKNIFVVDR